MSMNYHNLYHKMWTDKNGTFCQIREQYGRDAAFLSIYLITNSHVVQTGLYYCPFIYMAHDTGMSVEDVERHINNIERIGFCKYDHKSDVVWVIRLPLYQVGDSFPHGKDNRIKSALNKLATVPTTCLLDDFLEYWKLDRSLVVGLGGREGTEQHLTEQTEHKEPFVRASQALSEKGLHGDDS